LRTVKDRFSEFVDRVQREHERVTITKNGRPVAVLISVDDLEALEESLSILGDAAGLEDIRRGEFEGLSAKLKEAPWTPDFGPHAPHASAGATVIGARMPLIAYNINLGTADVEIAKKIARAIRASSGGFRYVKAMGVMLEERQVAQVSINMTDFKKTPLFRVFDTVRAEAKRYGVSVIGSEIVGLVPAEALLDCADYFLRLEGFGRGQVLENRIRDAE